jgi:predicted nucleotidyltransferase
MSLLPEQADAMRELQAVCHESQVDVVIIGAIALRVWLADDYRATEDVDAALALDLDEFPRVTERLEALGWRQDSRREHRWYSKRKARFDLLPVGERTRKAQEIFWPRGETRMRVIGYTYVFRDAVQRELAAGLWVRVAPIVVLALLKIVAYLDDPHSRHKDLQDLITLLRRHEEQGERRFDGDVLDAGVEYDEAGAYLLGRDLRALCAADARSEIEAIDRFLQRVCDPEFQVPVGVMPISAIAEGVAGRRCAREFAAFARGFWG